MDDEEEEHSQTLTQPSVSGGGSKSLSNVASKKSLSASQPLPTNYVRRIRRRAQKSLHNEARSWKQDISDLKLLADSASRSGNIYQALQAYHKMGVILDNQEMYTEAIQKYKQFLSLCITSKNTQGEALAYNCLGIDTFKVGQHDESIQYHNKHLELADGTGRLIAHTNLGIVFQAMGLSEHAAIHHQHAIEYANRMGAKDAQCFSVGNLAVASAAQGDLQTSRICLQYHLSAAQRQKQSLGDSKFALHTLKTVSNSAYHRLGQVNAMAEKFDEASSHFEKAIEVAKSKGDQQSEEKSGVMFGVAKGLMNFDKHMQGLLKGSSQTQNENEQ
jgi:tetratricopeptide (TPR) repeat protein